MRARVLAVVAFCGRTLGRFFGAVLPVGVSKRILRRMGYDVR